MNNHKPFTKGGGSLLYTKNQVLISENYWRLIDSFDYSNARVKYLAFVPSHKTLSVP